MHNNILEENTMNETIKTMLEQINYQRTFMMLGTRKWAYSNDDNWIRFTVDYDNSCDAKCKSVRIWYNEGSDTYTVQGLTKTIIKEEHENVYCDQLLDIIEEVTGMYVTLNRRH